MGKVYEGKSNFGGIFHPTGATPLEDRMVVSTYEDLSTLSPVYEGIQVYVEEKKCHYFLSDKENNVWKKLGTSGLQVIKESDLDKENFEVPDEALLVRDGSSLQGSTLNNVVTSINGTYLDIMMGTIRSLQAEVARLKNAFTYGIQSYKNDRTAMDIVPGDGPEEEPLWALDPSMLPEVENNDDFSTYLDANHMFTVKGNGTIDASVDGQLTFNNCAGVFNDGGDTLLKLDDAKLIAYFITDGKDISLNLVDIDDTDVKKSVDLGSYILDEDTEVGKYSVMVVISRKIKDSDDKLKGFNYVYVSVMNFDNNAKLLEGYISESGEFCLSREECDRRYSIESVEFYNLTLNRFKFYTKYEDFYGTDEDDDVIPSVPNESDYKLEAAAITIRSVKSKIVLDNIQHRLLDDEMIWVKSEKALYIKSDNVLHKIGSINNNTENTEDNMTDKQIVEALAKMGIIANVKYDSNDEITSFDTIEVLKGFTLINDDTNKKFTFSVNPYGELVSEEEGGDTISSQLARLNISDSKFDESVIEIRGFIAKYFNYVYGDKLGVNNNGNFGLRSDRLRISSFYAPLESDDVHGCTHSFIELENSSDKDIPLTGMYLHFYNPCGVYDAGSESYSGKVYSLPLKGVIAAGGTYLIRGAQHADFDDVNAFIKVGTYDQEWYEGHKLLSFEQKVAVTSKSGTTEVLDNENSPVKEAYRFCITYGLIDNFSKDTVLIKASDATSLSGFTDTSKTPYFIVNPRFVESCSFSSFSTLATSVNPWYYNGSKGTGITIKKNTMFRLTFALDPAKQAYNGFVSYDSSRTRYNKGSDYQVVNLDKNYIGFPHSTDIVPIDRYTPKASYEHKNVSTDKTHLDSEKPNMVTCSFGIDVYKTRCFNWISEGLFDEYVWIRKAGDDKWSRFSSYTSSTSDGARNESNIKFPCRVEFNSDLNNAAYARITAVFPGCETKFTSHKCIVDIVGSTVDAPTKYEYVVGRGDKDNNPDVNHTSDVQTFMLYPSDYEGRVYQITDQQGFHWIEYQVWAAAAEFLNKKITEECDSINSVEGNKKVFPILINTGDMTQSGARINEWLDYYNGGRHLFDHLEQMNCVGNNDLCPLNPETLGSGNDPEKSNARFFHYFYCFEVPNDKKMVANGKYIPSTYYFETSDMFYMVCNSEITETTCTSWFNLMNGSNPVNLYTGIEIANNGKYVESDTFTPMYETLYSWLTLSKNRNKRVVVACHEMPFTVITKGSLSTDSSKTSQWKETRNYPNGGTSLLGSHMNQLKNTENRGTFWFSRLLEQFNCKLVIGGHKHTYALSYPIKEKYTWRYTGNDTVENIIKNTDYDSIYKTKPMSATLADEAGESPTYVINWLMEGSELANYNIASTSIGDNKLNSTKTPYIPDELYSRYGKNTFGNTTGIFRCCTPVEFVDGSDSDSEIDNPNYDGYVNYSMCQATGYKLKSNKELPSMLQVFSKLIPKTTHKGDNNDSPNANQLYPMYSVLEIGDDDINVRMVRIKNIMVLSDETEAASESFNQTKYNKNEMTAQYLVEGNDMYGIWKGESDLLDTDKYLYIKY